MEKTSIRNKLLRILDTAPALKEALLSSASLDVQRKKIKDFLSSLIVTAYEDETPPLEWILVRNAIRVFRTLLSPRSERLVGYSFLQYIHDLLYMEDLKEIEKPSPDFFCGTGPSA